MTETPNAVVAKGGLMAIRSLSAPNALNLNTIHTRRVKSSALKRLITAGCLGMFIVSSTGCTMTSGIRRAITKSDQIDNFMIDYRNRAMAEKAWHCQKEQFCNHKFAKEFKQGFIDGYLEVAAGGNGCCPMVAPSQYWGWRYQSAQGQAAVNGWFEGYPMGARAAEQHGVGHWQQVRYTGTSGMAATGELMPAVIDHQPPVANPFYSEEHFAPEAIILGDEAANELDLNTSDHHDIGFPPEPDPVFNAPVEDFPVTATESDTNGLVSRFEVAERLDGVTSMSDQAVLATPAGENDVINDIFSAADEGIDSATSATSEAVKELPFSFE